MEDLPKWRLAELPQCLADVEEAEREIPTLREVCHRLGDITQALAQNNFESERDTENACDSIADLFMAVNDLHALVDPSIAEKRERPEFNYMISESSPDGYSLIIKFKNLADMQNARSFLLCHPADGGD